MIIFTRNAITRTDGAGACGIAVVDEMRTPGRPVAYAIVASCPDPQGSHPAKFVLAFDPSGAAMQLTIDDAPPVSLQRCRR